MVLCPLHHVGKIRLPNSHFRIQHPLLSVLYLEKAEIGGRAAEPNTIYGAGIGLVIQMLLDRGIEFYSEISCVFVWLKVLDKA
jgi:hypothetical protein